MSAVLKDKNVAPAENTNLTIKTDIRANEMLLDETECGVEEALISVVQHEDECDNPIEKNRFFTGILFALPITILLWALIITIYVVAKN